MDYALGIFETELAGSWRHKQCTAGHMRHPVAAFSLCGDSIAKAEPLCESEI